MAGRWTPVDAVAVGGQEQFEKMQTFSATRRLLMELRQAHHRIFLGQGRHVRAHALDSRAFCSEEARTFDA